MFPKDVLQRDACLNFLCKRTPGLHVGGKTALAWRGVRHDLAAREPLCLWASRNTRLPDWFTGRFPSCFTTKALFSPQLATDFALQPLPETPDGPPVAVPERALLEMLSDVGVRQGIEDARHIMEGARNLRMDVLIPLLKHCTRVKVVLLSVLWAEELALPWAPDARKALGRKMGHTRWMARLKDGSSLILKP